MLEAHPAIRHLHVIDRKWKQEGTWRKLGHERAAGHKQEFSEFSEPIVGQTLFRIKPASKVIYHASDRVGPATTATDTTA